MSFPLSRNETIKTALDILESATEAEQKRMLYLIKLEKAQALSRKLDKKKPR